MRYNSIERWNNKQERYVLNIVNNKEDTMSLNRELAKLKEENLKKVSKELSDVLVKAVEIQAKRGTTKNALKTGYKIQAFELQNA